MKRFILTMCAILLLPTLSFASKIHVLEGNDNGEYRVVIHEAMPVGNNSAGKAWKNCLLNAKDGVLSSILSVGTEPGNITQIEADSIIAGDVFEVVTMIKADNNASRTELINLAIRDKKIELQRKYKFYGHSE